MTTVRIGKSRAGSGGDWAQRSSLREVVEGSTGLVELIDGSK